METFLIKAVQLVMALAILVLIHEFGHYFFSRVFGVRVEKFYLFFNPWFSLFKYKPKKKEPKPGEPEKASWRDTEYGIGWLPLGGYCKIAGMIDESMDKEQMAQPEQPWEFRSKPAWQRLFIMIGGVLFNFILAIIIYSGIVFTWGEQFLPFRNAEEGMMFSPAAQQIGFQDGDIPLFADDTELNYLSGESVMAMVSADKVTVLRNKQDTVAISIPENFIFTANKEAEEGQTLMAYRLPVVVANAQNGMGAIKVGLQKGDRIMRNEEKRVSIWKVVAISAAVALFIFATLVVLYKFFKKYFKISFDCGDCDSCTQDCFGSDFDPLCDCDEDFAPECTLCDEADEEEAE